MKKDFYFVLGFSIFFLILGSLRLGSKITAWRRLAFYLIHPTAGSFFAAYEHASHLGTNWQSFFEAHQELQKLQEELKEFKLQELTQTIEEQASRSNSHQKIIEGEAAKDSGISSSHFSMGQVVYRGVGEKRWYSIACLRPDHSSQNNNPIVANSAVLQFSSHHSKFTFGGKMLPPAANFGQYPCFELLTSRSFAIAVQVVRTGESALVRGLNRPDRLILDYLSKDSSIQIGDILTTSSISLFSPPGILIGEVVEIKPSVATDLFIEAYLKPYLDVARLEEVLILSNRSNQIVQGLNELILQ